MTFKDTEGRAWPVRLTAGLATRIREATGVNVLLSNTAEGIKTWAGFDLPNDPEKFVAALWLLIEKEAAKRKVTREAFEEAFDADTYRSAAAAYYDAVLSFSPTPAWPKAIFGTGEEVLRRIESTTESGSATSSAGPSASTPGTSPSGS